MRATYSHTHTHTPLGELDSHHQPLPPIRQSHHIHTHKKNAGECYADLLSKWSTPSLYEATCDLRCEEYDYTHFTFIFTAFVMCQLFNECVPLL